MNRSGLLAGLALLVAAGCADARKTELEKQAALGKRLAASLVRVQYTLRYDRGEAPEAGEQALEEERPLEDAGFLVSPTEVVTEDHGIHPRFVERVVVRQGDDVVPARVAGWAKDRLAVILRLERPLAAGKPLVFDAARKPPYLLAKYVESEGEWGVTIVPMESGVAVPETSPPSRGVFIGELVTDADGAAVALPMSEVPLDDSWKGSPLAWPVYTPDEYAALVAGVRQRAERALLRTTLHLRSPTREAGARYRSRDDDEGATEINATGIVLEGGRVLVLASLKPNVTARLERIVVHAADGKAVEAKFAGSLQDYAGLVATLEKPLGGAVTLSARPVLECRYALLPSVEIRLHGENRAAYFNHNRVRNPTIGWRQQLELGVMVRDQEKFLFDPQGALLAVPLGRRERVSTERQWSNVGPRLVPVVYLEHVLEDLPKHLDPGNVPLAEATERRLAWLGVILQPLNRDLARANTVAELTRDGETGALVSYVYAGSPAEKEGIEPGMILLRLRVAGRPQPLEVKLEDFEDRGPFPWDRLDEVPETYYDRIPPPWEPAENAFNRALTDLGFGRKFDADFFAGGKVVTKSFEVTPSPTHYDSAPRFKTEALGLTVRDLTYEVRRYFQKDADAPGVVVSKIEPGSKAAVAGIKPYETITHVNDKPVAGVGDFEKAVGEGGELRFSVKRMTQGRVVKLSAAGPVEKPTPAARDAEPDEDAEP